MENSYNTNISRENPFGNLVFFFSGFSENKLLKTTNNSPLTDSVMQKQHSISVRELTCQTAMPVLEKNYSKGCRGESN